MDFGNQVGLVFFIFLSLTIFVTDDGIIEGEGMGPDVDDFAGVFGHFGGGAILGIAGDKIARVEMRLSAAVDDDGREGHFRHGGGGGGVGRGGVVFDDEEKEKEEKKIKKKGGKRI